MWSKLFFLFMSYMIQFNMGVTTTKNYTNINTNTTSPNVENVSLRTTTTTTIYTTYSKQPPPGFITTTSYKDIIEQKTTADTTDYVTSATYQPVATTRYTPRKKWYHPIIWDSWSFWGPCSKTCGQGIKVRTRKCLVWTGEKFSRTHLTACDGIDIGYKICNKRKCFRPEADYIEEQCKSLSKKPFLVHKYIQWRPQYSTDRPCELICQTDTRNMFYNFGNAHDGTRCHRTGNSICLRGECKRVGCDGVVESMTTADMCGVCNGKNDTCTFIHNSVLSTFPSPDSEFPDYTTIVIIPRGSRHFKVLDNSRNNIALMNKRRNFIINGDRMINEGGTYKVAGTKVVYIRSGYIGELFEGTGPLTEDIHIMLLYRQKNHQVKYEYWKPKLQKTDGKTKKTIFTPPTQSFNHQQTSTTMTSLSDNEIWKMLIGDTSGKKREKGVGVYNPRNNLKRIPTSNRRGNQAEDIDNNIYRPEVKHKWRPKYKTKLKFNKKKHCKPCRKVKGRKSQYCRSDFVSRILIKGAEIINSETRYDAIIVKNFKNGANLMRREYIWVPNICKCPKLKIHREFLVMGNMNSVHSHEIRLTLTRDNYVRKFKSSKEPGLNRMKRKLKCKY